jgi:hypothetical protein
MPFVSITRLRVRRWCYVPQFPIQSIRAARQAERADGSISVSVLRDADRAFWTRTVWRDEAAMRAFMRSGVHRRIMARLPEWCDEAALVRWVQDASEPPSWQEAHRRLQKEGRRSNHRRPHDCALDGLLLAATRCARMKRRSRIRHVSVRRRSAWSRSSGHLEERRPLVGGVAITISGRGSIPIRVRRPIRIWVTVGVGVTVVGSGGYRGPE